MNFTAATWNNLANNVIDAIRYNASATSQLIIVPSVGESMVDWFFHQHLNRGLPPAEVMQNINDPYNNFAYGFEVHQDMWNSGWEECTVPTTILRRLTVPMSWLKLHQRKAFLFWWTNKASWQCVAIMRRVLTFLALNTDVWIGNSYGAPAWWINTGAGPTPNLQVIDQFVNGTFSNDLANLRNDPKAVDKEGYPLDIDPGSITPDVWNVNQQMEFLIEHSISNSSVLNNPIVVWDYTGNQYEPSCDVLLHAMMDYVAWSNGSVAMAYYSIRYGGGDGDQLLDGSWAYAPKPDIVIDTFDKISYRYSVNDTVALSGFLTEYSQQTGSAFPDRFIRQTMYQYKFNDEWHAAPYSNSLLYMMFNVTTFRALDLPFPPPFNLTKSQWTWPRFVDTVQKISSYISVPFWMSCGSGKDDFHMANIARTYGGSLINTDGKCALNSPAFIQAFKEVIVPLFMPPNNATPLPWKSNTIAEIQAMPIVDDPLRFPDSAFAYDDSYNGNPANTIGAPDVYNGIWFTTSSIIKKESIWNTDGTKDLAVGLYPGENIYFFGGLKF
ncbi:hypothetical protein HDV00_002489 [Rhizophlyctis rosea]|nr:hypothetical protein HDV00_002489 [Rhizophlyctis rosea]